MDNDIWLTHCYGVSAGAVNATSYLSRQRGRTFRITADYINDKHYGSVKNLLTTGDLFGADVLYNRIPNKLDPFDYDAFEKSDSRLTAVHPIFFSYRNTVRKAMPQRLWQKKALFFDWG